MGQASYCFPSSYCFENSHVLIVGVVARPKRGEHKAEIMVSVNELLVFTLKGNEGMMMFYKGLI
jgi:hypothetical protein